MEVEKIDRINALAHKAKSLPLTEEEKTAAQGIYCICPHEPSRSAGQCGCSAGRRNNH